MIPGRPQLGVGLLHPERRLRALPHVPKVPLRARLRLQVRSLSSHSLKAVLGLLRISAYSVPGLLQEWSRPNVFYYVE